MKTLLLTALAFGCCSSMLAQEVQGVQKETVTKTVIVKGTNTEVKTVTESKETDSKIVLEKNDSGEDANYSTKMDGVNTSVTDQQAKVEANKENSKAIEELKAKQQAELEASKKAQMEKAKAESAARQAELEKQEAAEMQKRKAELENRPKGMNKLKKKKKDN